MITINEPNAAWLGEPAGTLVDSSWFEKPIALQKQELNRFSFVEFKAPLDATPKGDVLRDSGFFWSDVQISFRLALDKLPSSPSLDRYQCVSAVEQPFVVDAAELRDFANERFFALPGMNAFRLNARYAVWANQLIARQPSSCFRIMLDGRVQGWFLGSREGSTVNLTLAMLAADASSSGAHLYHKAASAYAAQGCILGKAIFSVRNMPVLNIYSKLGAQFMRPEGVWMWVKPI
jgi:hypothetical protein